MLHSTEENVQIRECGHRPWEVGAPSVGLLQNTGPCPGTAVGGLLLVVGRLVRRKGVWEGSGPSMSSAGPRPGVLSPWGWGLALPPSVCRSMAGELPAQAAPRSRVRKCLEVQGCGVGVGGPGSGPGVSPRLCPRALRTAPPPAAPPPAPCPPEVEAPQHWGWGGPGGAPACDLLPPLQAPPSPVPGGCTGAGRA